MVATMCVVVAVLYCYIGTDFSRYWGTLYILDVVTRLDGDLSTDLFALVTAANIFALILQFSRAFFDDLFLAFFLRLYFAFLSDYALTWARQLPVI